MRPHSDPAPAARAAVTDCWNTIGVRGDASCPELTAHVHCRNCPMYSAAAVALLDSAPPPNYTAEWTRHFAQEQPSAEHDAHSVVIFRIATEWLALPTPVVKEIADLRPIHSLPHRHSGVVLGVVNVRGELLVCLSISLLLGLDPVAESAREQPRMRHQRLLVIHGDTQRAAFPVDQVHGTHRLPARELRAVPATVAKAAASYTKAIVPWQDTSVALLDDQVLLAALSRRLV